MRLPIVDNGMSALGVDDSQVDEEAFQKIVDVAMANGYNYFDTSWFLRFWIRLLTLSIQRLRLHAQTASIVKKLVPLTFHPEISLCCIMTFIVKTVEKKAAISIMSARRRLSMVS